MRDPYVVGATIFCYGIDDKRWKTYDIAGDFARVLREQILVTPTPPIETPIIVEPPPVGATPTVPGASRPLRLIEAFGLAKQTRDELANGEGAAARAILTNTLIRWFDATAPQNSQRPAQRARILQPVGFVRKRVRRIEANKLAERSRHD